jgi:hypothetical protein
MFGAGHGVSLPRHRKLGLPDLRTNRWRNRVKPDFAWGSASLKTILVCMP